MSLPENWIDQIFTKLTLIYGRDFAGRWEGMNIADVKADWAHELDGLDASPQRIAYALKNLPTTKPPTVLEFRATAWKMPADDSHVLIGLKQHRGTPPPQAIRDQLARLKGKVFQ